MKFVNRHDELEALRTALNSKRPAFVRVLGRRRVGKTDLIVELCKREGGVYLLVDEEDRTQLISNLAMQLAHATDTLATPARNWDELFESIRALAPRFVVLDEFQRLIEGHKSAVTRLQDWWDRVFSKQGPSIILCGSSIGMMQRLTHGKTGPLFGRLTADLPLRPFTYRDMRLLYPELDETERIRRWAIFGGTPHYHHHSVGNPIKQAIQASFLSSTAPFIEEPQSLLYMELKDPARYNSILYEIGLGTHDLPVLESKIGVKSGGLGPYLGILRKDLGLIKKEDPVCGRQKRARYVFTDPFFSFYYRYIFRSRQLLELGRHPEVWKRIKTDLESHIGRQFEQVVREAIVRINGKRVRGVAVDFEQIGSWWNRRGEEIDIVASGSNEILAGEVKWSGKPLRADVVADLLAKIDRMEDTHGLPVRPLLVTRAGLTQQAQKAAKREHALVLSFEDLKRVFDKGRF